jgi:hypothetical protein
LSCWWKKHQQQHKYQRHKYQKAHREANEIDQRHKDNYGGYPTKMEKCCRGLIILAVSPQRQCFYLRRRISITLFFLLLFSSFISKGRPPIYRIYGIDSTSFQYKIRLIRVSDQSLYTIYSSKIENERINELIKEKYVKIKLGECYRLRFYERIPPIVHANISPDGNSIYHFDIDRLEGLYYDTKPRSIFKKYYWKTPKNKRIAKNIGSCKEIKL